MDQIDGIDKLVLEGASPRHATIATIRAVLSEDFEDDSDDNLTSIQRGRRRGRRSTERRLVDDCPNSILDDDVSDDGTFSVFRVSPDVGVSSRHVQTVSLDDFGDSNPLTNQLTSRPLRTAVRTAARREARNRRLREKRNNRELFEDFSFRRPHRLPPMITLNTSDSDSEEDKELEKKRKQEEDDYLFALKVSEEWNKGNDSLINPRNQTDDAEADGVHCIICFDKPRHPFGCIHCRQLIGCKKCILKWRRTTNISSLNRSSPLSSGLSSLNHKSCPLCRVEWEDEPEVAAWEILSRKWESQ